jgi:fructosamine-3-kinase
MSSHEIDISWQVLRGIVQEWAGTSAELSEVKPLTGGAINTTLALRTHGGDRAVLKISPHRVNRGHQQEAFQLNLLRELGLPVPRVYTWNIGSLEEPFSYILLEFLDGIDLGEARKSCTPEQIDQVQEHLAELVLAMHEKSAPTYMRVTDDGTAVQQYASWPQFYHDVYDTIWHDVEKSGLLPIKQRKQIGRIHEKLDRLIAHADCPRLVHWDIWATNLLVGRDAASGDWRICGVLDPNCKYAHAEAEIAYMELFHTVTPAFLRSYQRVHRLPAEYQQVRKHIYQLYPLLNHVHLFGQGYVKPLLTALERCAAVV